jgi:hypothetical protein
MTDRIGDEQLDREIRTFLAWQAEDVADAPSAMEMAMRVGSRVGTTGAAQRLSPQLVWVLLAGLLIAALIGALAIGGFLPRNDRPELSYEAVFLRLGNFVGPTEVQVIGVGSDGRQRQIARLPGAWSPYAVNNGYLAPMGAVSSTGLLAMPISEGRRAVPWKIFDVERPQAEPILIDAIPGGLEQVQAAAYYRPDVRPSVFWGPGDRVAIPWYVDIPDTGNGPGVDWHLVFAEGRTGAATSVDIPAQLTVLPRWASDGSGVAVSNDATDVDPRGILRPDGSVAVEVGALAESSCRTRYRSGLVIAVSDGRAVRHNADGSGEEVLAASGIGFGCLAPDDSTIVLSPALGETEFTRSNPVAKLIALGSGTQFDIEGTFAGWLEVDR